MVLLRPARGQATAICALVLLAFTACDDVRRYGARGVVEDVVPEHAQVVIAHGAIRGLMPAMTMNFDVPDPALLAQFAPGQEISFTLVFTGQSYQVVAVRVLGEVETGGEWARLGERLVKTSEAPGFALTDQAGSPLALEDLAGKAVLLDFIFTSCPGPCPILTARQVSVQRAIPEDLREAVRFVSITLDPEKDTPAALEAYALEHGASLGNWSFLTGSVADVEAVIRAYHVGKTLDAEGTIEHLVAAFLVDGGGRILKRYLGLDHASDAIAADVAALARNPGGI